MAMLGGGELIQTNGERPGDAGDLLATTVGCKPAGGASGPIVDWLIQVCIFASHPGILGTALTILTILTILILLSLCAFWREVVPIKPFTSTTSYVVQHAVQNPLLEKCCWGF